MNAPTPTIREVLEPFAKAADKLHEATPDVQFMNEYTVGSRLTVGDLRRARTFLESIPADGGVVKALKWNDKTPNHGPETYEAESRVGYYQVFTDEDSAAGSVSAEWAWDREHLGRTDAESIGRYPDFDEAKAAAQADFECRVLSCFSTPSDTAEAMGVPVGEVSVELMQRIWANLFYDEENAGFSYQGTLNDVVDWLAAKNALPEPSEGSEVREIATDLERAAGKPLTEGSWGGLAVEPVARAIAQNRAGPVGEAVNVPDNQHRFAVTSSNYSRPYLLGCYSTLDNALLAQGSRPDLWEIFERVGLRPAPEAQDEVERLTNERDNAIAAAKMLTGSLSSALVALAETRERLGKMEAKSAILDGLLSARDVWTDYGSGFRVHFSFDCGTSGHWVARLNEALADAHQARAALTGDAQEAGR